MNTVQGNLICIISKEHNYTKKVKMFIRWNFLKNKGEI